MLPKTSTLIPILLAEVHSMAIGGHSGFTKTYTHLAVNFYWKGMKNSIMDYIRHYDICYPHEYQALSLLGYCNPFPFHK